MITPRGAGRRNHHQQHTHPATNPKTNNTYSTSWHVVVQGETGRPEAEYVRSLSSLVLHPGGNGCA